MKFTSPELQDQLAPGKAVWPGQGIVLTLTEGQCSDGMSDRTYPFFAEVVAGIDTYKGCATQASALKPAS